MNYRKKVKINKFTLREMKRKKREDALKGSELVDFYFFSVIHIIAFTNLTCIYIIV